MANVNQSTKYLLIHIWSSVDQIAVPEPKWHIKLAPPLRSGNVGKKLLTNFLSLSLDYPTTHVLHPRVCGCINLVVSTLVHIITTLCGSFIMVLSFFFFEVLSHPSFIFINVWIDWDKFSSPENPSVSSIPLKDRVSTASHLWTLVHVILALEPDHLLPLGAL